MATSRAQQNRARQEAQASCRFLVLLLVLAALGVASLVGLGLAAGTLAAVRHHQGRAQQATGFCGPGLALVAVDSPPATVLREGTASQARAALRFCAGGTINEAGAINTAPMALMAVRELATNPYGASRVDRIAELLCQSISRTYQVRHLQARVSIVVAASNHTEAAEAWCDA